MCFACEGIDAAQLGISPALAARARRIETTLPGRRVAEEAWEVLLGQRGGSLPWPVMQRLMTCLSDAENSLCARLRCGGVEAEPTPMSGTWAGQGSRSLPTAPRVQPESRDENLSLAWFGRPVGRTSDQGAH